MATVTQSSESSVDMSTGVDAPKVADEALKAGEDLPAGRACYIDNGDGQVYLAQPNDGTATPAADQRGNVVGITARSVNQGEPVTPFGRGVRWKYADAGTLTPGSRYYVGPDGQIEDTAQLNDQTGLFLALTDEDLMFTGPQPTQG